MDKMPKSVKNVLFEKFQSFFEKCFELIFFGGVIEGQQVYDSIKNEILAPTIWSRISFEIVQFSKLVKFPNLPKLDNFKVDALPHSWSYNLIFYRTTELLSLNHSNRKINSKHFSKKNTTFQKDLFWTFWENSKVTKIGQFQS